MANYIVDPSRFQAEGALLNWAVVARRLGVPTDLPRAQQTVQLRWMLGGDMGMPSEPFQVWARVHGPQSGEAPIPFETARPFFLPGIAIVSWAQTMAHVSVDVVAPAGGVIMAFAGAPLPSNVVATATVPAGAAGTTVTIAAAVIDGLLVSSNVSVSAARGIRSESLTQAAGWTLIERVGIPVSQADWAGIGRHGTKQGLASAPVDAPTAAVQRLTRGAPPVGWGPLLAPGVPAPPWEAPDYKRLVREVNRDLLDALRGIVAGFAPNAQAAQRVEIPLPAPENSSGDQMTADGSTAQVSPLAMTFMAATGDPFLALALGFGTAYPLGAGALVEVSPRMDYMITAHWDRGLDGASAPVDYAALVPAPGAAVAPPPPANMASQVLGSLRPITPDGDWRASVRVSWDRSPDLQLFRTASTAFARAGVAPPQGAEALLEKRDSGGFRPLAINRSNHPPDPEFWRLHAVDRELPVPSNPGSRTEKYGAAVQDLYGQWTPWVAVDQGLDQPALEQVHVASARLRPGLPAGGGSVCPAELDVEFLWDWRVRSPRQVAFVGRLYATTEHGAPPPAGALPAGLDRGLGVAGSPLVVTFAGDVPSAPGATLIPLDEGGEKRLPAFGPGQGDRGRRYRLTLAGLALDFAASGHIGLAIWAQGQERIAPQRVSDWSTNPTVITTSDPRPPVVPVDHVALGSLPDAAGQSHARVSWSPQPGAVGYFIYEATETTVLRANGLPEPGPDRTLDDRLKTLKDAFRANPSRREFTRLNATMLAASSQDVALPKGSTSIHLYVVIGVSAGRVEGDWPGPPDPDDALIAVAAPHVMRPAAPMLEVTPFLDTSAVPPAYKARVSVTTRGGPRPRKVDVHRVRVDDAARDVDTMGPPVARIRSSGGGWNVTEVLDPRYGSFIGSVSGTDAAPGSWRRVWYRATAWTDRDDTRGGLPGRSPASTGAWVVLPPAAGPVVGPIALGGGADPGDIVAQWSSAAPLKKTPLGPHVISVRAAVAGAAPDVPPILAVDAPLSELPAAAPAAGSGAWVVNSVPGGDVVYRALIRRASAATDTVRFAVRITDPLGRVGEALATIPAGPVDPAPDLEIVNVVRVSLLPPRVVLTFTSAAPLEAPLDGPYQVTVTAVRNAPPFPPAPPLVIHVPVGSVPTAAPWTPLTNFFVLREAGAGPVHTYTVTCRLSVRRFVVRVTAPDGRFVEQIKTVS